MIFSEYNQGDVLKIEHVRYPIVVASKSLFNSSGMIVGCPFIENGKDLTLHVPLEVNGMQGFAYCEMLKSYDLNYRSHKLVDKLSTLDTMEVADAIQSIFDYVYP